MMFLGEQGEQGNGRDRADASDDSAAAGRGRASPTGDGAGAAPVSGSPERFGDHRGGPAAAGRVRRVVQTIMSLLAVTVRLVASVFAVVLVVRIGLAFVAVNPHNIIVEWIVRFADVLVWGFRDLFVPADPRIGLVANYGLAAVFWVVVGVIVAWVLSGFGRLVGAAADPDAAAGC
jgi:hypothetical protein